MPESSDLGGLGRTVPDGRHYPGAERPPFPVLNITVTLCVSPCVCQQAAQLFYVGLPSSYSLPALEAPLPRLPSYESVRKKDRQRQIHMMIADRFGLNGPIETEVGDIGD